MTDHGDVFDERYVALVRAGEVGGILDETLALIGDLADRERDIEARLRLRDLVRQAEDRHIPGGAADTGATEQAGEAALFCEVLGMLLGSGVPLRMALETSAALLPADERRRVAELASGLDAEGSPRVALEAWFGTWAFIAPAARVVLAVGARTGTLDHAAAKAAEYLVRTREALALDGPAPD
jgi:type II secretory pathway component PulF